MTKPPSTNPKRYAEIVDAAAEVFAEKGYHGASTKDIADRLGIQQAGIYYYFKSKDAALAEVCRLGVAGFVERAREIVKSGEPTDIKIRQAIAAHLRPIHKKRNYVRVFQQERRYLSGDSRKVVSKLSRSYELELQGLFADGIQSGALRKDLSPELATLAMLGMCNLVTVWYRGTAQTDIEHIAKEFADIILDGAANGGQ